MTSKTQTPPQTSNIPFVKGRYAAFAISILLSVVSLVALFTQGLNFGIDFRGGSVIEARTVETADLASLRAGLSALGVGDVQVQLFGDERTVLLRIAQQDAVGVTGDENAAERAQLAAVDRVRDGLRELSPGVVVSRVESVGGKVSGELVRGAQIAVAVAIVFMAIYILFRFEWQFSVGAVLALVHDVIMTLGMFAITGLEFNLASIAAILTIVGYSMNDTVVVYDRIRETLRKYKKTSLAEIIDLSINVTLSRTLMTSLTTLIALIALFVLGGEVLRGFAFAMIFGISIGTYSSIFVASPLLLLTGVKRETLIGEAGAAA